MNDVNENQETPQGGDFTKVAQMFKSYYEKPKENESGGKLSKDEILAKYFTPRNSVEMFRILPPLKGRDIIESAYFHYVPVNNPTKSNGKGFKKIYCPSHNSPKVPKENSEGIVKDQEDKAVMINQRCPLCEKKNEYLAKQTKIVDANGKFLKKEQMNEEQLKIKAQNDLLYKEAMKYDAKKYYIVRGIDRGKIKDGVKFWRFKDNYKKQGILDKLIPALSLFFNEKKVDPTDINKGTDLYINVVDSPMPTGGSFKDVSSISTRESSELFSDPLVVDQWLSDPITWRDLFKPATMTKVISSEEYLERVAKGTDPYWDETDPQNKKYVFPDPNDRELQEKSNKRDESLETNSSKDLELASDLSISQMDGVSISNVTEETVGDYNDGSVDIGSPTKSENTVDNTDSVSPTVPEVETSNSSEPTDYDDLPF